MIVYTISCERGFNTDNGGHSHSLAAIASEINEQCAIIVFGDQIQKPLRGHGNVHLFECSPLERVSVRKLLRTYGWLEGANVLHSFDMRSSLIANRLARRLRIPLVVTKPGGPKRKIWNARFQNQIVFHSADYKYFSSRRFLRPQLLDLQTGRVHNRSTPATAGILEAKGLHVVRIGRIGYAYSSVIAQALKLGQTMREQGIECTVSIIGVVQDADVLSSLKSLAGQHDCFYMSEEYTRDAQRYLPQADVVVGTGRGFAEGLREGKLMFFPVRDSALPCFATSETIQLGAEENFSPRAMVPPVAVSEGFSEFMRLAGNQARRREYSVWAKREFRSTYALEAFVPMLKDMYSNAKASSIPFVLFGMVCECAMLLTRYWKHRSPH